LGARKSKGINVIANIGYDQLCLREKNIRVNNNYTIKELYISLKTISNKPFSLNRVIIINPNVLLPQA
jgi:hypothetical protein